MNCPRCGGPLRKKEPSVKWLPSFECDQCWLAFEVNVEKCSEPCDQDPLGKFFRFTQTLQPGRTPRPTGWMR